MKRPDGSLAISGTENTELIRAILFQHEDEHADLTLDISTIPRQETRWPGIHQAEAYRATFQTASTCPRPDEIPARFLVIGEQIADKWARLKKRVG